MAKLNFIGIIYSVILSAFLVVIEVSAADEVFLPRTLVKTLQDPLTKRSYEIHLQLPISYSPDKKYPVVYMTDSPYTFPITVGAARYPANFNRLENILYVGISWQTDVSPEFSRQRDYTPTKVIKGYKDPTGGAENHVRFIRDAVIAYVEQEFSVDSDNRTYVGNSYGGLLGSYILLTQPDTFKNYILGSPSLWWDDQFIFKLNTQTKAFTRDVVANVFISVGENENPNSVNTKYDLTGDARHFYKLLNDKHFPKLNVKLQVIQSANHSTAFPTTAIQGLWWLFNKEDGVAK